MYLCKVDSSCWIFFLSPFFALQFEHFKWKNTYTYIFFFSLSSVFVEFFSFYIILIWISRFDGSIEMVTIIWLNNYIYTIRNVFFFSRNNLYLAQIFEYVFVVSMECFSGSMATDKDTLRIAPIASIEADSHRSEHFARKNAKVCSRQQWRRTATATTTCNCHCCSILFLAAYGEIRSTLNCVLRWVQAWTMQINAIDNEYVCVCGESFISSFITTYTYE